MKHYTKCPHLHEEISLKPLKVLLKIGGDIEAWFFGDNEWIDFFLHEMGRKIINTPKLNSFNWPKEKNM